MTDPSPDPLPRLRPAQARALRSRLQRLIHDAGQTDLAPEAECFWELDPTPIVISAAEWGSLSAGLIQRARLVNALLRDLYSSQAALRQKVLPPEMILGDPHYRRPCLNLEPDRVSPATLLRFDLTRAGSEWLVTSTFANTPVGLSYAVQNRRFLSQEAPHLYAALPDYESIINTPLQLLDALRQLSPRRPAQASIVVLTAGPHDPFYSEHSFLARKMGVPLARGDDLLVLDNCVYFKTVAGLERVDVIYRRLGDAHIDPVVFPTLRQAAGVPGLLHCVRRRSVVVANAIGSGLAENRAIEAFLPQLCRFYLGEDLRLPGIPTHLCTDADQLDALRARFGELRLRNVHPPAALAANNRPEFELVLRRGEALPAHVAAAPYDFVVQETPPTPEKRRPTNAAVTWSAFVISQSNDVRAMPGGLVRVLPEVVASSRIGLTADLVVLQTAQSPEPTCPDTPLAPPPRTPLGSRTAESLYWLGRYLERAESTARMLSIFDDVALEEIPARDRRNWLPVWQGLLEAAGYLGEKLPPHGDPSAVLSAALAWRMALDASHPSSIYSSVHAAAENARQLRDCISPEVWVALSHLDDELQNLLRSSAEQTDPKDLEGSARAAAQHVVGGVNAVLGTAERTLLQDASWRFLLVGLHLERAIMTCSALRHSLGALEKQAATDPGVADRDNPELSALVRMLGSQDAYRRLYRAPSLPHFVTDFFLHQPAAPGSLLHNVNRLAEQIDAVAHELGARSGPDKCARAGVDEVLRFMQPLRFERDRASAPLAEQLSHLLHRLYGLHSVISDHYFSHQGRLPAAPLTVAQVENGPCSPATS